MVDFSDAVLAPREHKLGTPIILLMAGNEDLVRTFLMAYGYEASDLTLHLAKRLTSLFLYDPKLWLMRTRIPESETLRTLEDFQSALFPFTRM